MDWVIANLPMLIILALLIGKVISGLRRGFVKELCALISIIGASIGVLLVAFAIRQFFDSERVIFILTLILIVLLAVVYKIIDLALTTLKVISKIPGVGLVNKLCGVVIGVLEVVVAVWAVYCLIMVYDMGAFERWIMNSVQNNAIMKSLFEYNYLYSVISNFSGRLKAVDIWGKLGM